jgi:hypothetical protein
MSEEPFLRLRVVSKTNLRKDDYYINTSNQVLLTTGEETNFFTSLFNWKETCDDSFSFDGNRHVFNYILEYLRDGCVDFYLPSTFSPIQKILRLKDIQKEFDMFGIDLPLSKIPVTEKVYHIESIFEIREDVSQKSSLFRSGFTTSINRFNGDCSRDKMIIATDLFQSYVSPNVCQMNGNIYLTLSVDDGKIGIYILDDNQYQWILLNLGRIVGVSHRTIVVGDFMYICTGRGVMWKMDHSHVLTLGTFPFQSEDESDIPFDICGSKTELYLIMGKDSTHSFQLSPRGVLTYDTQKDVPKWQDIPGFCSMPFLDNPHVLMMNDLMFLFGNYGNETRLLTYDPVTKIWNSLPSTKKFENVETVFSLENALYVYESGSCCRYDQVTRTWETSNRKVTDVRYLACIVTDVTDEEEIPYSPFGAYVELHTPNKSPDILNEQLFIEETIVHRNHTVLPLIPIG